MSLENLPEEIIQHILYFLPGDDILSSFQLLSHRLYRLSQEPLLWRYHCVQSFKYWHPEHEFSSKLRLPVSQGQWKELFEIRSRRGSRMSALFDSLLETKVGRYGKIAQIGAFGYDAKGFLLEQSRADDSDEYALARRYFGQTILSAIHRSVGIDQWQALSDPERPDPPLESVLGAFDMFVLSGEGGDLDEISSILDSQASQFREATPSLDRMTLREKALTLNRWIRAQNLTGLANPQRDYRNLRNCLIGQALRHEDHESIPIISSAIFCCLAQRIGLDAQCCNFPGHIHCVVTAPPGWTLDNGPRPDSDEDQAPDRMYLDPFGEDAEVPLERLATLLRRFGNPPNRELALAPARVVSIVNRVGSNLGQTYATALEQQERASADLTRLLRGAGSMNLLACLYASMWAALTLTTPDTWAELDFFLTRFSRSWPEDAWLVERFLVPRAPNRRMYVGRHAGQQESAWKILKTIQRSDDLAPTVFRRTDAGNNDIPYRIGQVFRHKRYGYLGVVTGWSDQSSREVVNQRSQAGETSRDDTSFADPMNRLRLDNKTYFTYLRTSSPERYVIAEPNMEIVTDPADVEADPFIYAGKFFKRFDRETCEFVSNIREQFPDD